MMRLLRRQNLSSRLETRIDRLFERACFSCFREEILMDDGVVRGTFQNANSEADALVVLSSQPSEPAFH
jgi:hypothetical protein